MPLRQLLHDFPYSPARFIAGVIVFACLSAGAYFWFGVSADGHQPSSPDLVPLGFLLVIVAFTGIYNARTAGQRRLRLFDEGMQFGPQFIAWSEVTGMELADYGSDAQSFHLQVSLRCGAVVSVGLHFLTRSPREIFRLAHAAWQASEGQRRPASNGQVAALPTA